MKERFSEEKINLKTPIKTPISNRFMNAFKMSV